MSFAGLTGLLMASEAGGNNLALVSFASLWASIFVIPGTSLILLVESSLVGQPSRWWLGALVATLGTSVATLGALLLLGTAIPVAAVGAAGICLLAGAFGSQFAAFGTLDRPAPAPGSEVDVSQERVPAR